MSNMLFFAALLLFVAFIALARRLIKTGGSLITSLPMADLGSTNLVGKSVVVVGGTSGVGLATCHGLIKMGANLVVGALNEVEAARARTQLGKMTVVLPLDLRSSESINCFVAAIREQKIPCDLLISSAGVCSHNKKMLAVNFVGTVRLVQAMRPLLEASVKSPRVVLVASDSHRLGELLLDDVPLSRFDSVEPTVSQVWANQINYGTTKLYLICFLLEYLRRNPGLKLQFVQPGAVDTPMGEEHAGIFKPLLRLIKVRYANWYSSLLAFTFFLESLFCLKLLGRERRRCYMWLDVKEKRLFRLVVLAGPITLRTRL